MSLYDKISAAKRGVRGLLVAEESALSAAKRRCTGAATVVAEESALSAAKRGVRGLLVAEESAVAPLCARPLESPFVCSAGRQNGTRELFFFPAACCTRDSPSTY